MKQSIGNSFFILLTSIVYGVGLASWLLSELSLSLPVRRPLSPTGVIVVVAIWMVVWTSYLVWTFYIKGNCGRVLLDCGFHPLRLQFLGGSFFILVFCIFSSNLNRSILVTAVFGLTISLIFLHLSLGQLRLTDKGIWCYWSLVKWESFTSWEWADESRQKLLLHTNSKIPFCNLESICVPEEFRDQIAKQITEIMGTSRHKPSVKVNESL